MGPFVVNADAFFIFPGFITVVEVTFLMPPRLKFSLILSTCDALFFFRGYAQFAYNINKLISLIENMYTIRMTRIHPGRSASASD